MQSKDDDPQKEEDTKIYIELLEKHLDKVKTKWPSIISFLNESFTKNKIEMLASVAAEKHRLSIQDKDDHTAVFCETPLEYAVSFFPVKLQYLRNYIKEKYGGFLMLLEDLANHTMAQLVSCTIMCHIIFYYGDNGLEINMAITPTAKNSPGEVLILPTEFLTQNEQDKLSL